MAICGSGVGACIAPINWLVCVINHFSFSAHQGVEDDNMNVMMCLGGQITGYKLALELTFSFLHARFKADERFIRRLSKITTLERENIKDNITK